MSLFYLFRSWFTDVIAPTLNRPVATVSPATAHAVSVAEPTLSLTIQPATNYNVTVFQ